MKRSERGCACRSACAKPQTDADVQTRCRLALAGDHATAINATRGFTPFSYSAVVVRCCSPMAESSAGSKRTRSDSNDSFDWLWDSSDAEEIEFGRLGIGHAVTKDEIMYNTLVV